MRSDVFTDNPIVLELCADGAGVCEFGAHY